MAPEHSSGPLRVLMTTEGTYPYLVGGVTTWCRQLVGGLHDVDWTVLPIVDSKTGRNHVVEVPPNVALLHPIVLWGRAELPRQRGRGSGWLPSQAARPDLAAVLARGLFGWESDTCDAVSALAWCRRNPDLVLASFRARGAWETFVSELTSLVAFEAHQSRVSTTAALDGEVAVEAFNTLSWIARTAAVDTPVADVTLVTAAGWAAVPALVDKAIRGTPMLLVEHGVYVREAYLAAVRSRQRPAQKWLRTRLARGLARASYRAADLVVPVSTAHRPWEESLGVQPERVQPIPNAVALAGRPAQPPPLASRVVSVGRVDPLKDVHTMLRVAASVRDMVPGVRFQHFGPVPAGQEDYAASCYALHAELDLGDTFVFMGPTTEAFAVVQQADVVLMTSISEGFPMALLEALAEARPVVTTDVGGVLECVRGAGITAPAGDVNELAAGVVTLLEDRELAARLGARGRLRVKRLFDEATFLASYRSALHSVADVGVPA